MRIDALDHFAVEFEHQPEHAVRGRMLRPEIDREIAKVVFGHGRYSRCAVHNGAGRGIGAFGSRHWVDGSQSRYRSSEVCKLRTSARSMRPIESA